MDRKAIEAIKKFASGLKKDFSVEKIIFFGSRTGDDYLDLSDIDLVVISPDFEGIDLSKRMSIMYRYWNNKYDVDFLCYTPKEFGKFSKMISIAREAVKTGIIVK